MAPPTYVVDHARTAECPELLCLTLALLVSGFRYHHLEGRYPLFIAHTSSCANPAPSFAFVHSHFIRRSSHALAGPLQRPGPSRPYPPPSFPPSLPLNPPAP